MRDSLARLRLRAGHADEALRIAERAAALAPAGRPHEIAYCARSLRDHLAQGAGPLAARHLAIGGMSFCGSTLLGFLLDGLPGVANLGESHALICRCQGDRRRTADLSPEVPENRVHCTACRVAPCPVWTTDFRRALANDPVDWYGQLTERVGEPVVVSSDKSHAKLSGLDPLGQHDLIVLFKRPETLGPRRACSSTSRRTPPSASPAGNASTPSYSMISRSGGGSSCFPSTPSALFPHFSE